jgi:hypothetical protein
VQELATNRSFIIPFPAQSQVPSPLCHDILAALLDSLCLSNRLLSAARASLPELGRESREQGSRGEKRLSPFALCDTP